MSNVALYGIGAIAAAIFLLGRKSAGEGGTNLSIPFFPDIAGGYAQPEAGVRPNILSFAVSPTILDAMFTQSKKYSPETEANIQSGNMTTATQKEIYSEFVSRAAKKSVGGYSGLTEIAIQSGDMTSSAQREIQAKFDAKKAASEVSYSQTGRAAVGSTNAQRGVRTAAGWTRRG